MAENKVAIIGAGPGGYIAAIRAAQLGLNPLLFEEYHALGGTCLHRGCIPTKALLESANRWDALQNCRDFGLDVAGTVSYDFSRIQQRKQAIVKKMALGLDGLMKKNRVTVVHGHATLAGLGRVAVGEDIYEVDNIVLATGSEVCVPGVFPVDGKLVVTSDHILDYAEPQVPESLIVVGAGAVGMEFASMFSRLGSKVTVVEMCPTVLPLEDAEVSAEVARLGRKRGLTICTNARIEEVNVGPDSVQVKGAGLPEDGITAAKVLVAVGRQARLAGLGLETVGLEPVRGRLSVDEHMQTSVPGIYAIGDLVPTPQLAHVASAEGLVAVEHIAGLEPRAVAYNQCPAATYCHPEVASVGLTEARAVEAGHKVKTGKFPFLALGKAAVIGETDGFVKVVADADTHELLGAHILGAHATDMIAEAVTALERGSRLEDLAHAVHPHPTLSEAFMEAVHQALGAPLNFVPLPPRRPRA